MFLGCFQVGHGSTRATRICDFRLSRDRAAEMREKSQGLDAENPCKLVAGLGWRGLR